MYLDDSGTADVVCLAGILAEFLWDGHMSPWLGKQPVASGISNGMLVCALVLSVTPGVFDSSSVLGNDLSCSILLISSTNSLPRSSVEVYEEKVSGAILRGLGVAVLSWQEIESKLCIVTFNKLH